MLALVAAAADVVASTRLLVCGRVMASVQPRRAIRVRIARCAATAFVSGVYLWPRVLRREKPHIAHHKAGGGVLSLCRHAQEHRARPAPHGHIERPFGTERRLPKSHLRRTLRLQVTPLDEKSGRILEASQRTLALDSENVRRQRLHTDITHDDRRWQRRKLSSSGRGGEA